MDVFAALLHETLLVTAFLSLPILTIATVVALAIAVVQAATSLQEQSIAVLPKIGLVGTAIVVGAPCGMAYLQTLFHLVISAIPNIVASNLQ
jgi:flagellar biosynthetic protein FliQ